MLLRPSHRDKNRGYTIVEALCVMLVLALITTPAALIIGPLLRSQNQTQAKVDTVQAADMALYRIERDLRNTTSGDIFVCTTNTPPSCALAPTALTDAQAIVMPSAHLNGTGQFQLVSATGRPYWQGASVYWIDAQGDINYAFDPLTGTSFKLGSTLSATDAQNAVTDVTNAGGMQLARFVEQLSFAVTNVGHQVQLQMQARSTVNGAPNETTYRTDVQARNGP